MIAPGMKSNSFDHADLLSCSGGGVVGEEMEGAEVEKEESGGSGARTHCDGRVVGLLETPWRRVLARVLEMEAAAMLLLTSESTAYDTGEGSWVRGLAKSNELHQQDLKLNYYNVLSPVVCFV